MQNMEAENKRLKRHFEFIFLADGDFKECQNFASLGANEIAFDLDAESLVSESDAEWMPLSKFCKPTGKMEPDVVCPRAGTWLGVWSSVA